MSEPATTDAATAQANRNTARPSEGAAPDSGMELVERKQVSTTVPTMPGAAPASIYTTKADPMREYVSGGGWSWYNNAVRTLPWSIDDVTGDLGDDLYEQMLKDPQILSCVNVLKTAILASGVSFVPYQAKSTDPVPPLAQEMTDFIQRVWDDLETPGDEVLWNMLDSLAFGNKVAELVYIVAYRSNQVEVEVDDTLEGDDAAQEELDDRQEQERAASGRPGPKDLEQGATDKVKRPIAALPQPTRQAARQGAGGAEVFGAFRYLAERVFMALNPTAKPSDMPDPNGGESAATPAPASGQMAEPDNDTDPTSEQEAPPQPVEVTQKQMVTVSRPYLELRRIKVKERRSTAFIVDPYMNVIGILGLLPGQFNAVMSGSMFVNPTDMPPNVLPRSKFCVMSFRPQNADPRGTSILRAAYNAWWLKRQTWPEYLKYLAQFAAPSVVGFTAPDEEYTTDVDDQGIPIDGATITSEQAMLNALMRLKGGSAAVFKNGAEVQPLQMMGDGKAFRDAIELFNTEMTIAILHQKLATMDSTHDSRAAAEVHQDTLQTIIRQGRNAVIRMIRNDIIIPLIRFNFGEEALAWAPQATLGVADQVDFVGLANAVAALMKAGYLDPSQMQEIDIKLGLAPRPQASVDQQVAAKQAGYQLAAKVASGEIDLGGGADGDTSTEKE